MKNPRHFYTCTALLAGALSLAGCGGGGSGLSAGTASTGGPVIVASNGQLARSIVGGTGLPDAALGVDGDYFLNTDAGRLYGPKAGGVWPAASLSLVGPVGPAGATGAAGPAGATGAMGAAGPAGPVGPGGSSGSGPGLYSGTAAPGSTLGRDGDFYLNFTDRLIVGPKAGGVWPSVGVSVVGPAGAAGATGAAGAAGTSLLSGAGAPNNAVGGNGDYYINTSNSSLIGPKSAGVWPVLGISLVGPAGPAGATGAAGASGPAGPAGVPGATGGTGAAGTPGTNGTAGPAGPAGTSVLAGAGAPAGALGNVGDLYFDSTARTLIGPKTGAGWPAIGTALNGATGANGTNGTNGTNGRTILNAAVNPVPGDGANGDFFINTFSSTLFGPKAGGAWPAGVSLVGTNGAAGVNGAAGTNGRTILSGTGNPNGGDGADGDFFINTASSQLFGPKAASTWPAGVSLVGPAGANGKTILNGSSDPVNATGTNGDFFINTTTNTLFGPKNAVGWPTGVSLVGPAAGVVAPEIFACTAGATTVVAPAATATRTLFCNFNGSNPGISGTRVNLVLPAASTYASGTVITFRTTGTIFPVGSPDIRGVPLQFFFQSTGSTYTGYDTTTSLRNRNNEDTTSAIELFNREGALFSVMAVGTRWFQVSP